MSLEKIDLQYLRKRLGGIWSVLGACVAETFAERLYRRWQQSIILFNFFALPCHQRCPSRREQLYAAQNDDPGAPLDSEVIVS